MRICIIAEGSYPYITGGVSSWIQMLISEMPEHEFIIYAIGAEESAKGKFVYTLPPNVISVKEIFLDSILKEDGKFGKNYKLTKNQKSNIVNLITGEDTDILAIYDLLKEKDIKNVSDFFKSKDFFSIVLETSEKKYEEIPFTEFFWSVRSMLMPLFYIINQDIPEASVYHSVSTGYAGIIGSFANLIYNRPYILTEHGIYTREREEEIIRAKWLKSYLKDMWIGFFYSLSRFSYVASSKVVTLFSKNKVIEIELGCKPEKIDIIPNGIDVNLYKDIEEGKDETTVNIGAVLRVVPIKDVKTMLESFLVVSRELDNVKFYIMGPTEEDEEYYRECVKFKETLRLDNVIFTGRVNVKDYIGKMDILVLSSISEGQPLAILEGMACRKPFVTTNVGSCSELIYGNNDGYGQAGYVVPLMNYSKMGESLIKLCKDKELRKEMGQNGFNRVANLYTLNRFIEGYKKIYEEQEVKI